MQHESWLVKKDRVWAMRCFQDKQSDEDGTRYVSVHYDSCRRRFLHGITPHVQLHESEKLTYEKQENYGGLQSKQIGKFLRNLYGRPFRTDEKIFLV